MCVPVQVACETATKDNMVMVFGEITTEAPLDYEKIVRNEVKKIGFDSFVDDLASVDSKGLSCDSCEVTTARHHHSPHSLQPLACLRSEHLPPRTFGAKLCQICVCRTCRHQRRCRLCASEKRGYTIGV